MPSTPIYWILIVFAQRHFQQTISFTAFCHSANLSISSMLIPAQHNPLQHMLQQDLIHPHKFQQIKMQSVCPVYLCFCSLRDSIIFCLWFICPCSVAQVHSNPCCCCCSGKSIRLLFISSFVIWPGLEGPSLNEEATRSEFVGFCNTFLWLWLILSCLPSPVSG